MAQDIRTRFMLKVDKRAPDDCWLWTGAGASGEGYGQFKLGSYKRESAHRVSYRLFVGDIPTGQVVRHKCDVRLCVNPAHLELGSQSDNVRDAVDRGRMVPPPISKGACHPRAKLTDDDVADARAAHGAGANVSELARKFGVGWTTMSHVIAGRTWR